jgi:prepilin-type N-terminal cleavage/methylation domain-containing protein
MNFQFRNLNLKIHRKLETGDWKFRRGFTLIELLVVISIIGILAALSLASFTTSQKQARDTERKSDLSQYRSSLESYANIKNGLFPVGQLILMLVRFTAFTYRMPVKVQFLHIKLHKWPVPIM